jgi:hypothetical protein
MPELSAQYHHATDFSLDTINCISGAKPFIRLIIPGLNDVAAHSQQEHPYFNLQIQGVPDALAKKLATTMGVDFESFPSSSQRQSRDLSKNFKGGKTIDIAMNAHYTADVLTDIERFVGAKGLSAGQRIRGLLQG